MSITATSTFAFPPFYARTVKEERQVRSIFNELSSLELTAHNHGVLPLPTSIKTEVRKINSNEVSVFRERNPYWSIDEGFFCIDFHGYWEDYKTIEIYNFERNVRTNSETIGRTCINIINTISQKYLIIFSLAFPELFSTRLNICEASTGLKESGQSCHNWLFEIFDDFRGKDLDPKWDFYRNIRLKDCISWIRHFPNFWERPSENSVGRTLNYFSNIFHGDFELRLDADIMWAISGVEAFYCDNSSGVQKQMHDRMPRFLIELKGRKGRKVINEFYNFRSRLLHGDLNIRSNFSHDEDIDEDDLGFKILNAYDTSAFILTKTLQKCVKQSIIGVEYKEKFVYEKYNK